ncbi:recombinase family protein [Paenarthrobacter nitroguajacolicus]|uniref:recombinase family protein n=1 Tax=Paenarthrobacter nitroguajacolicus TaxID=211146 RepID=UPI003DA045FB
MLIGYMRVSKADGSQTTDLQRDALLAAGIDAVSLYEDRASGKKDDRPELTACLRAVRRGDTLVVWKLDRLGRDLRHLVNIVHNLTESGIGLKSSPAKAQRGVFVRHLTAKNACYQGTSVNTQPAP